MSIVWMVALLGLVLILTWGSVRLLRVPERHELLAGSVLTVVYALLAFSLAALVLG